MKQEIITVQNLKCQGCVQTVAQVLGLFPEITNVEVDLETSRVSITTQAENHRSVYESALSNAGYPPVTVDNPSHQQKAPNHTITAIY